MTFELPLLIITIVLALVSSVSGIAKVSGNPRALAGISIVLGLVLDFIDLIVWGLVTIWIVMIGALFFHFKSGKIKSGFPAFAILTVTTIALTLAMAV
ncbi:MAG: hypothetical protein EBY74_01595 [Actinobacteria bacterium]|nr:hypothetical protein [Actinomycetota bacterium]